MRIKIELKIIHLTTNHVYLFIKLLRRFFGIFIFFSIYTILCLHGLSFGSISVTNVMHSDKRNTEGNRIEKIKHFLLGGIKYKQGRIYIHFMEVYYQPHKYIIRGCVVV